MMGTKLLKLAGLGIVVLVVFCVVFNYAGGSFVGAYKEVGSWGQSFKVSIFRPLRDALAELTSVAPSAVLAISREQLRASFSEYVRSGILSYYKPIVGDEFVDKVVIYDMPLNDYFDRLYGFDSCLIVIEIDLLRGVSHPSFDGNVVYYNEPRVVVFNRLPNAFYSCDFETLYADGMHLTFQEGSFYTSLQLNLTLDGKGLSYRYDITPYEEWRDLA